VTIDPAAQAFDISFPKAYPKYLKEDILNSKNIVGVFYFLIIHSHDKGFIILS
jgi:hypothetical protein